MIARVEKAEAAETRALARFLVGDQLTFPDGLKPKTLFLTALRVPYHRNAMQRVRWYRRWRTWAVLLASGLLILVLAHGPILRGESLKVIVSPTPQRYFPEAYRFDADNWWKDERQIGIVIGAWTRLVYYWLLYDIW